MKQRYFDLARKLCERSNDKFRLGCVVVKGGRIVSIGWNVGNKTSPGSKSWGNYIHAEYSSLLGVDASKFKGATAYVFRLRNNGTQGNSRPCQHCSDALKLAGIKKVYYSADSGYEVMKFRKDD